MKHPLPALAALALLSFSVGPLACSSSGPADSADSGSAATFTAVYTTVFSAGTSGTACTSHHSGGTSAAGNLDLSTQALAYTNLVGVPAEGPSCGSAALDGGTPEIRVVPGNPAASLLYQKVDGTPPPCGGAMPALGTPISATQLALVKAWIDDGAPNN